MSGKSRETNSRENSLMTNVMNWRYFIVGGPRIQSFWSGVYFATDMYPDIPRLLICIDIDFMNRHDLWFYQDSDLSIIIKINHMNQ